MKIVTVNVSIQPKPKKGLKVEIELGKGVVIKVSIQPKPKKGLKADYWNSVDALASVFQSSRSRRRV